MNSSMRDWGVAAVALVVALVALGVALKYRGTARRLRGSVGDADRRSRAAEERARESQQRFADLESEYRLREAEDKHMVEHRLPVLVKALWEGSEADMPGPLHGPGERVSEASPAREEALEQLRQASAVAAEHSEASTKAVVSTIARSMQGLLNDTTTAVDTMIRRHHDPAVLEDATKIDHASSQLVRRLQVINILTGSWPGRQRLASPLLEVVRGGVSRIRDYDRIKITGAPAYSTVSHAVEPVVLAVAELLDNAARYSEPGSDVQVGFVQAHNGVTVVIDDAGVGLTAEAREHAALLLSGEDEVRLTGMGSRPKFGFAAVGALARRYGFTASVDQESIYGGVRAGLFLPSALLVTPDYTDDEPDAATAADSSAADTPAGHAADSDTAPAAGVPARSGTVAADAAPVATEAAAAREDADVPAADADPVAARPTKTTAHAPAPAGAGAPAGGDGPPAAGAVPRQGRGEEHARAAGQEAEAPQAAHEEAADESPRPDGLPQRRRRKVRQRTGGTQPAQPPADASRSVAAFARGIARANRSSSENERTKEQ